LRPNELVGGTQTTGDELLIQYWERHTRAEVLEYITYCDNSKAGGRHGRNFNQDQGGVVQ
jgi:hypothetical protein